MLDIENITFTLTEWLSIMGLVQCLLILVYIIFRVNKWRQASLAISYFFILSLAFGFQFSLRLEDYADKINLILWFIWGLSPALSYLLILQVAKITEIPPLKEFWVLSLMPIVTGIAYLLQAKTTICEVNGVGLCDRLWDSMHVLAAIMGFICLLALWGHRNLFENMLKTKGGRERYWLSMSLIIVNILLIGAPLLGVMYELSGYETDLMRLAVGIAFVYLASTTLFRVYPSPVQLREVSAKKKTFDDLTFEEQDIAEQVLELMKLDKLYHEQSFSRSDMARELKISENQLSRVINAAFGKSFPKLLNEYRVEDAKRMLEEPDIPVNVIAFEVGFNSLASFNRVFKNITGYPPSSYRSDKL